MRALRALPVLIPTLLAPLSFSLRASAQQAAEQPAAAPTAAKRSPYELFFNVGFSHWYGQTFGAPVGASTPAFVVGVRPGLGWLQLRLHYTASIYKLELPTNGQKSTVGFANLDALLSRELRVAGERMIVLGGLTGGFVHTSQGIGPAFGSVLAAHYMIDLSPSVALGPFFDFRWQLYRLPKSDEPFYRSENGRLRTGHSDAQSQIGVALSFR